MTDALAAFLKARFDEVQQDAERGYLSAPEDPSYEGWDKKTMVGLPPLVARQVLREVEAKQRIVDRHSPHSMGSCRTCERPHWGVQVCDHCERAAPCPDLRDLAAVYADHPNYLPEWQA